MMAHITIGMQVSHVTKCSYSPFKSRLMLMQLIAIFLVYLMHLFALNKLGTKFYQDVILILFSLQVVFQTHYVLKIVKEVANALQIRIFCVKEHYPEQSDTSKLASTTGLEKTRGIKDSSPGRKIANHRLNQDTQQESSGEDHSIEGPEGLEEPTEEKEQDEGGSSKLIK